MARLLRRALAAFAAASSTFVCAAGASAQTTPQCIPGTQWCVKVDPNNGSVSVQPPPVPPVNVDVDVRAQQEARARAQAQAEANARLEAYARARAVWDLYFQWEARLRADVELRVRAQLQGSLAAEERAKPDPYLYAPPPITPPPHYAAVGYPRVELGTLSACFGVWSRPGHPTHAGWCPDVRFRFDESWGIALDPSIVNNVFDDLQFVTVGVHPAVTYSFANARGSLSGSHGYLIAGLDLWTPIEKFAATPDVLGGAHVGFGARVMSGPIGFGAEWRALVRTGFSDEEDPRAADVARWRVGAEARIHVFLVGF